MKPVRSSRRSLLAMLGSAVVVCGVLVAAPAGANATPADAAGHSARSADPAVVAVNILPQAATAASNGLAATPPMGFNDWNAYGCNINEDVIKQTADAFVSNGMRNAGYQFVNIDDCWQDGRTVSNTDAKRLVGRVNGHLVADPVFFPSGMPALADYIHARGLKFGLYSSNGTGTCQNVAGTFGHETTDANDYAAWGVDYFKLDTCNSGLPADPNAFYQRYKVFGDALRASGRDVVFSICDFTQGGQTWLWGSQVGNLWRTTGDISANYTSMTNNFLSSQTRSTYAGPGGWNDPDMLEIGTGGFSTLAAPAAVGDTNVQVASAGGAVPGSAFRIGTKAGGDLESFEVANVGTAAGPPTTMFGPASAGDTNVKVPSTAGFTVGNKILVDTGGTYESPTISAVGTAGTQTALADAASAGTTNVKVASTSNLAPGDTLSIDDGQNSETATITGVGTAASPASTTVAPVSAGDTNVRLASTNGVTAGDQLLLDSGGNAERATVTSVGSAAGPATTLAAPAAPGDTNVKVASTNGMTVGHPIVIDSGGSAEVATITGVGTGAGPTTTTIAPVNVGDTNIKISNTNGFAVGDQLVLWEQGYLPIGQERAETATITGIGTAAGPQTTTVSNAKAGDTNIKVGSTDGFVPGQPMQIKDASGANFETAPVAAIGSAAGPPTTLAAASKAGDTNLKVTSIDGFSVGQDLVVGVGATQETATVTAVGTAGADGTGITVAQPLKMDHLILMLVRGVGTGITLATPLTRDHASGSTTRGQGTGITVANPVRVAHPLATTGGSPGGGINIRDVGTGVSVTPLTEAHQLGVTTRDTGTGVDVTPLSLAHSGGVPADDLGTGVTLAAALTQTHAAAATVRDESKPGTGITFSPALTAAHPVGAVTRGGGTGITLTSPVTRAHAAGSSIGKSGMSLTESRTHFSLWAMASAPLLAGTDVADMAQQNLDIYLNKDAIAVDQDLLGKQGDVVRFTEAPAPAATRSPGPPGFGNAVPLNGSDPNRYVELPNGIVSGLSDFTAAAWVNRASTTSQQTWARVFDFGSGTTQNMFLTVNAGGAGLRFAITTGGSGAEQQITAPAQLPTGWHHVAVTLSGNTGTLYVDGQPVATNPNITLRPSSLGTTTQNWIGRSQYNDPMLNATVDDFQIYNRALSQAEIQSLMASPGGSTGGGNVAWYRFDEAGGATALDSSGNGHDAHIVTSTPGDGSYVIAKPLANGDVAVALWNNSMSTAQIITSASEIGAPPTHGVYLVRDLWATNKPPTVTTGKISATVPAHGTALLRVATKPPPR